ncbi:MAG: ABC transporter permease [Sporolactobacillus sp.]|nr:ABC transporter permease [Sporolactobacillus sp.]MCI1882846.1 ABC transporter permease [Sporolactobacillus sp.]
MKLKLTSLYGLTIVIVFWCFMTYSGWVSNLFLPTPSAVLIEAQHQIVKGIMFSDIAVSFYRILIGFLAAQLLALPIGILMGTSNFWKDFWEPIVGFIRYMPVVAFIPLSILWLGTGDVQKLFIIFLGVFFQEVIMIADNCKVVNHSLIEVGLTLGFSRWEVIKDIIVKASLPAIWDTLRTVWGWAWTYLVVAELVAATSGLGYRIMQAQRYLSTETIILDIIIIGLLGLVTDLIFAKLAYVFFPWRNKQRIYG